MLSKVARVVESAGLQIGARQADFGNGGLRQNLGGDILNRGIGDFMNEADVPVFAGGNTGDYFAPGDFGIDHGLAPAPAIVDHYHEILQCYDPFRQRIDDPGGEGLFLKIRT